GPPENIAVKVMEGASISDVWDAMIKRVDTENHPLASKLREGDITFGPNTVKIVFSGGCAIHADSVGENLPVIKKMLDELSGMSITISIETTPSTTVTKKDLKERALRDPVVQDALKLFEGRIVDVLPIKTETK
ncbi:MAG TPA: hypothetical protein VJW95_05850, partial [Dissulfurispiraceae bacterium]|nr:hypothetical protein [Dissulfurispiraceae bacterium]